MLLFEGNLILNNRRWSSAEQVRQQGIVCKSLVKQFINQNNPLRTHLIFLQSSVSTPRTNAIPSRALSSNTLSLSWQLILNNSKTRSCRIRNLDHEFDQYMLCRSIHLGSVQDTHRPNTRHPSNTCETHKRNTGYSSNRQATRH